MRVRVFIFINVLNRQSVFLFCLTMFNKWNYLQVHITKVNPEIVCRSCLSLCLSPSAIFIWVFSSHENQTGMLHTLQTMHREHSVSHFNTHTTPWTISDLSLAVCCWCVGIGKEFRWIWKILRKLKMRIFCIYSM